MAYRRAYTIPARFADEEPSVPPDGQKRKQFLDMRREARYGYGVRFSCSLIASLCLMLLTAKLPITEGWRSVGWYVLNPGDRVSIELIDAPKPLPAKTGTPITGVEDATLKEQLGDDSPKKRVDIETSAEGTSSARRTAPRKIRGRQVFDTAQLMPQIVGGVGSYYIHIEYPEEAMQAGIEGRLVLSFVVEPDGHTTGVEVVERLHPACDSAAVRALRRTRFVPGRQNGDTVRVRMRLPVRFDLVDPGAYALPPKSASS